jgi:hypothetical protein
MPELDEQLRRLVDGSAPSVTLQEIRLRTAADVVPTARGGIAARHARSRRVWFAAAAVLAAAVLAAGTLVVLRADRSPVTRASTPTSKVQAPHWQLIASLSSAQFQLASGNPGAVSDINCGGSTCFLSTFYGVGGDTALTGSTYVSHDDGRTWAPTTLPAGVATATAESCVDSSWCAAGGGLLNPATGDPAAKKEMRDPELLVTTDGGATWTMHAVPIAPDVQQLPAYGSLPAETTLWPGEIDAVDCTAVNVCDVVGHVLNSDGSGGGMTPDTLVFLRTTDGGVTWVQTDLPERSSEAGYEEQVPDGNGASLACPTPTSCVVVSQLAGFNASEAVVDAWRTSDGGRSWQESEITAAAHGIAPGLSCPDADNCWVPTGSALLHSTDGGATWSMVATPPLPTFDGLPGDAWRTVSCSSAESCVLGGPQIEATSDGGKTWAPVTEPASVGTIQSLACEPHGACIALANPSPPPGVTHIVTPNGSSLVLTSDPPDAQ